MFKYKFLGIELENICNIFEFQCILADNDLPIDEPSSSGKPDDRLPNYYQANPPTAPDTISNAQTPSVAQTTQRRSLFAFEEIYSTWFCFSLFTDGFANWRLVDVGKLNLFNSFAFSLLTLIDKFSGEHTGCFQGTFPILS